MVFKHVMQPLRIQMTKLKSEMETKTLFKYMVFWSQQQTI